MAEIPGQKVPMIGETDYTIRFTGEHRSHSVAMPPAVGGYFETLFDAELEKILEEARGKRYSRA